MKEEELELVEAVLAANADLPAVRVIRIVNLTLELQKVQRRKRREEKKAQQT